MARNRTFGNLQSKINAMNLTPEQAESLKGILNTMNRRYFQLELTARKSNNRTNITRYSGAKTAVTELLETFNGNNILVEKR